MFDCHHLPEGTFASSDNYHVAYGVTDDLTPVKVVRNPGPGEVDFGVVLSAVGEWIIAFDDLPAGSYVLQVKQGAIYRCVPFTITIGPVAALASVRHPAQNATVKRRLFVCYGRSANAPGAFTLDQPGEMQAQGTVVRGIPNYVVKFNNAGGVGPKPGTLTCPFATEPNIVRNLTVI